MKEFTASQKKIILERDGYKCVTCGRSKKDGVELHINYIKPKDKGGDNFLENGQVLCTICDLSQKNNGHTESGKKMFIRLYELSKKEDNQELMNFTKEVLETFEKHNINGHIEWDK